ncbi:MAG TPA: DUF3667 domain-containing protein [Pyrinomonadaceae bacterium]|nr:DUF3667 domain-containing protein [Pyrinomonadaceae bacterium]
MLETKLTIPPPLSLVEACANCDAALVGVHCHECGQKKINPNEFAVKRFLARAVGDITDIESNKIFKTFVAMLIRPGVLTVEYLAGRRGNYIGPVKLYLTFSALYFLFAWGTLAAIRGGATERTARMPYVVSVAAKHNVAPTVLADKIHGRAEKLSSAFRFFSVLISGTFLAVFYFGMKKYYVEHLVFSLYYYSFDFFCKSVFALAFIVVAALGGKLPVIVLNLFYPIALIYLAFALKKVYQQKWLITGVKAAALFACETFLFIAVNVAGFIISFFWI